MPAASAAEYRLRLGAGGRVFLRGVRRLLLHLRLLDLRSQSHLDCKPDKSDDGHDNDEDIAGYQR